VEQINRVAPVVQSYRLPLLPDRLLLTRLQAAERVERPGASGQIAQAPPGHAHWVPAEVLQRGRLILSVVPRGFREQAHQANHAGRTPPPAAWGPPDPSRRAEGAPPRGSGRRPAAGRGRPGSRPRPGAWPARARGGCGRLTSPR